MSDFILNLKEKHGGHWGQHDQFPVSDWRYEVVIDSTRLGYWEWVADKLQWEDTNA